MARKLKPGPKRAVGRPSVVEKRKRDRERLADETERLAGAGFRRVSVWVPVGEADRLVETSPVHRLAGLRQAALARGEAELAAMLELKLEAAEQAVSRARAERSALARTLAAEQRDAAVRMRVEREQEASKNASQPMPADFAKEMKRLSPAMIITGGR